ncbi:MAG: hypothetical protein A3I60_00425 [Sulfuricurvum sp. RIFCSPLOWO2_02_FULL_43_45]|nr:MAG: hypothetical protein A3I60_00425 [Sulfuricurvum sp. RIFCSPLOWO2_02_FULL_43_45]
MENDHYSILDALYDPNNEEIQYTDLTIQVSTLVHDRLSTACRKTNLSVDSFLSVAIIRALHDYEQYSNRIK